MPTINVFSAVFHYFITSLLSVDEYGKISCLTIQYIQHNIHIVLEDDRSQLPTIAAATSLHA